MPYEKNHIFPQFQLKKWGSSGGKLLVKKNRVRPINLSKDFQIRKYYWIKDSPELEKRFSHFECYISNVITKIENSETNAVSLTSKELYLLKLYCKFAAERQEETTKIILSDEFGLYRDNDYKFGTFIMKSREEVLLTTTKIIERFEAVKNDKQFIYNESNDYDKQVDICDGIHLVIFRNKERHICVGDVCGIIENTSDNDHLYFYYPVSPSLALLLVNSEYYETQESLELARKYLPRKFHVIVNINGILPLISLPTTLEEKIALSKMNFPEVVDDPYLSYVLDDDFESNLCNSYYGQSVVESTDVYTISIIDVPNLIVAYFNNIFYLDSEKFIFIDDSDLKIARELKPQFREIQIGRY